MSEQHEEYEVEAIGVEVNAQPIELYKVLKIANAVSGGGEAKFVIAEGYVAVNGELEQRKRRKVYDGDVIEFNEEFYLVICDQPITEQPSKPSASSADMASSADTAASVEKASSAVRSEKNASRQGAEKGKRQAAPGRSPAKKGKGNAKSSGNSKAARRGKSAGQGANRASGPADKATGRKPISF
ncbi:RNA-binding S4 domain-containing protein [Photobacterium ganghwense]|uniref:RNA-binding S4 domain-containing protein n=1 Tax=Photobacterium ganghwense TaxID=320778 RepID=UPI0040567B03